MNNFEMNDLTQQLVEGYTPYQLAKALIKSVQSEVSLLDNGCGNDIDFNRNLMRKLEDKQITDVNVFSGIPVCRDCDGTGLFYQIEDCTCHCQMSRDEQYNLAK